MICVSISEPDFEKCLNLTRQFDLCEIRLDLCRFDHKQIEQLFGSHKKLLATFRPGVVSEQERMDAMKTAIKAGAAFVDIEIETDLPFKKTMIDFAKQHQCASIISYHNYDLTPPASTLENIIEEGFSCGAKIVKIASLVKTTQDNAALMSVYSGDRRLVVFGMGEKGMITRIAAPLMGAEFTFAAPDEKNATAPGQLSYKKLRDIYCSMGMWV